MSTTLTLRPEVLAFAILMEERLSQKDEDKGQRWKSKDPFDLICDTGLASHRLRYAVTENDISSTIRIAVDLANFSMMVADVSGALNGADEHVRRIAACLNACEGISDDVLKSWLNPPEGLLGAPHGTWAAKLAMLGSQREELLEALNEMMDYFGHDVAAAQKARAIIAKIAGSR